VAAERMRAEVSPNEKGENVSNPYSGSTGFDTEVIDIPKDYRENGRELGAGQAATLDLSALSRTLHRKLQYYTMTC
jgi:hypothetical protein